MPETYRGNQMAKYKPGQSGNIKGKPKGALSAKTKAWDKLGEFIVNDGAERYSEYLNTLSMESFANEFRAILEYFKPRQQRTEIKGEITTGPKKIGFEE